MNLVLPPVPPPVVTPDVTPARWPSLLAGIMVGIGLTCIAWSAFGAEQPTERTWVVWLVDADKPWTSAKGYQATATVEEACRLAMHEVTGAVPTGTRLKCRKVAK